MKSEPRSYFGNSEHIPDYWPGLWSRWKGQLSLASMRLSSKRKEKEDKDTYHNGRSVLRETPQLHGDWSGEFGIYKDGEHGWTLINHGRHDAWWPPFKVSLRLEILIVQREAIMHQWDILPDLGVLNPTRSQTWEYGIWSERGTLPYFPYRYDTYYGLTLSVLERHSSGIRSIILSLHFRSLSRSSAHSHSLPRVSLPFLSPFTERTEVRIYYTYHYTTCSLAFRSLTLQYRVGS